MEAFLISAGIVALAEIGDKTQLLSLVLAARFKRPLVIILGIFVATIVNHALAGTVGAWIGMQFGPDVMRWILAVSFIAIGLWMLIPDRLDENAARNVKSKYGVFATTLLAFFLAEMGDKTQFATVALAARFDTLFAVVLGTTLGMMLANVPVVLLGKAVAARLPIRVINVTAAVMFACMGVAAFWVKY